MSSMRCCPSAAFSASAPSISRCPGRRCITSPSTPPMSSTSIPSCYVAHPASMRPTRPTCRIAAGASRSTIITATALIGRCAPSPTPRGASAPACPDGGAADSKRPGAATAAPGLAVFSLASGGGLRLLDRQHGFPGHVLAAAPAAAATDDILALDLLQQHVAGAKQARADGAERHAGECCRLLVGQPLDADQHQELLVFRLQRAELAQQILVDELVDLIGNPVIGVHARQLDRDGAELLMLAVMVEEDVAHDGEEPQAQPRPGLVEMEFLNG